MPIGEDVAQKVRGFNKINNGSAIVYCWPGQVISSSGNYQALISPFEYNKNYSTDDIELKLGNRFDDVRYYFETPTI